jgi:hypothetical protein
MPAAGADRPIESQDQLRVGRGHPVPPQSLGTWPSVSIRRSLPGTKQKAPMRCAGGHEGVGVQAGQSRLARQARRGLQGIDALWMTICRGLVADRMGSNQPDRLIGIRQPPCLGTATCRFFSAPGASRQGSGSGAGNRTVEQSSLNRRGRGTNGSLVTQIRGKATWRRVEGSLAWAQPDG